MVTKESKMTKTAIKFIEVDFSVDNENLIKLD